MHLIMNALEEVTSRAHPNVSEISLLITLVSASAGFKPAGKKKKPRPNQGTSAGLLLCSSRLFRACCFRGIQVLLLARLNSLRTPRSSLLHSYSGNLNGE